MKEPGFFLRIGLALSTFVKVLFNGRYAAQVISIGDAEVGGVDEHSHDTVPMDSLTTAAAVPDVEPPPPIDENALNRKALQFIGALQQRADLSIFSWMKSMEPKMLTSVLPPASFTPDAKGYSTNI